ncbi:DUF2017 family protein [uncultured Pseudokineococcus sp.]|uniref:DUF2017 family protein n=1 Tax=uncultured Pseudokineococcus sp. TaxID=1642928 RepID=UPI0026229E9E|nr:DUF2017 family protein [uncultured Pseudokineococcus sp.]
MARRFRRTRRGITAGFEPQEAELVAGLLEDVARLLAGPAGAADAPGQDAPLDPAATGEEATLAALARQLDGGPVEAPHDPALARLLPTASDDDDAAAEFRRFAQEGLADRKRSTLLTAAATLRRPAPLLLTDDEARAWLTALTDLRLVLAQRLGLETDDDAALVAMRAAEADEDDPASWTANIYDFLTWLQEGLADVLLGDLPDAGGPPRR